MIPDPEGIYGPGLLGPMNLQKRAADAIRRDLKGKYPNLRVEYLNRSNRDSIFTTRTSS